MEDFTKKAELTLIIPAYNEAENIRNLISSWIEHISRYNYKIIFMNDGSTDQTMNILKDIRPNDNIQIIHHKVRRGYGAAIKTAVKNVQTDYAITFDADGQHQLSNIEPMLAFLKENNADLVIGQRINLKTGGIYRSIGRFLILQLAKLLFPLPIKDLNSGFKLFRAEPAKNYIRICPNSMAFSDVITLIFINQGKLVLEYPIETQRRLAGESGINTYSAFETIWSIINITILFNPIKIFLPLSLIIFLTSIIWSIPIAIKGNGISVGSAVLFLTGLLFLFIGMIIEQLSIIIKRDLTD